MFKSSVVSYPERGKFGKSSYRGNTTGYIVKDFLETYHKNKTDLFCDPAMGSDTSGDVARSLNVNYQGLDLYNGFNLCRDNLLHALAGNRPKTIFFHPPYHDMIKYSGNMWGPTAVNGDMSNCASVEDFLKEVQLGIINIYDSLEQNGIYGVLIGNMRRKGEYIPLTDYIRELCVGKYVDEIIKIQHNCVSDQTKYVNNFVPIKHEKLYVFKKTSNVFISLFDIGIIKKVFINITWKNILRSIFVLSNQKQLDLTTIYESVAKSFSEKVKDKSFWKEKVRQTLQNEQLFTRIDRGVYSLA